MKIRIVAGVRYAEDASVNGVDEDNEKPVMPFLVKSKQYPDEWDWDITIDVEAGSIDNWPKGMTAKTWYKVCDCCKVCAEGKKDYYEYVPKFLSIWSEGFGDYVYLEVGEDGVIKDWDKSECMKFVDKMEDADED